MGVVLVSVPGGAGVVRTDDGATVVTDDVVRGHGTHVRVADPHHPVKSWVDEDRSVVGGLLPPGAVSAEAVDDLGRRVAAEVGDGAYAAIIAQPNDGHEPIICCRDEAGSPVRRPLPADYPSVPVTDTDQPCPACGAIDYEEYVPTEQWRGGRVGPNGVTIPNPVVVCRVCGQEEREGTFFAAVEDDGEDEAARAARTARARAEMRDRRWYTGRMTLRAATFPIYAAEGWPALLGGSGSSGDRLTRITICHPNTPDADLFSGHPHRLEVTTSNEEFALANEVRHARQTLEAWVTNRQPPSWPNASRAAITLWLAARHRRCRGIVLAAELGRQRITFDGAPHPCLILTASTGSWVAVRTHHDLIITIAGHDLDPTALTVEPIADPAAHLLGPRPRGPRAD